MTTSKGVPSNYVDMTDDASPSKSNWAQFYGPNLRVFYRYFDVSSTLTTTWRVTDTRTGAALRYYPVSLVVNKNYGGDQTASYIAIVNGSAVTIPANVGDSGETRISGTTNGSGDVTFKLINSNSPEDAEPRPAKLTIAQPDYIAPLFSNITVTTGIPETSETKDFLWAHFIRPKNYIPPTPPTYLWSQEFTEAKGSQPSSKFWNAEVGDGCGLGICGWGNSERQYYTAAAAATDGSGNLVITATKQRAGALPCYYGSCEWASARYQTQGKVRFRYGLLEARIKTTSAAGAWPAFWLLGSNISTVGWPRCGEVDIGEWKGASNYSVWGTGHWSDSRGNRLLRGANFTSPAALSSGYHVYGLAWKPDQLQWLVDGQAYFTLNKNDVAPNAWPFNSDMYLIINLAMGGNFVGAISPTVSSATMTIDWIHHSQINGYGQATLN